MYCDSSVPQRSRIIVGSRPGYGTGDTIFTTSDGREALSSGTSLCPAGYYWDAHRGNTADTSFETFRVIQATTEPEEPPERPRYVDPNPRPPVTPPKVRPNFRVTRRPEFHARSNPR